MEGHGEEFIICTFARRQRSSIGSWIASAWSTKCFFCTLVSFSECIVSLFVLDGLRNFYLNRLFLYVLHVFCKNFEKFMCLCY